MKNLEHQFRRLLRAAAAVPPRTEGSPEGVPSARWLLRQREQAEMVVPATLRPVLQGGLAVACLLLLAASLVNVRQIERVNQDVFALPEAVLTRLVTP